MRLHGWIGVLLVAVAWPLNQGLEGVRTHLLFFPLWLGYVLLVDGLVLRRTGSSPWTRSRRLFLARFVLSIPLWWLFELFNLRLGNWEYVGREHFGDVEYFLLCSLSFSTVVPAVFTTAELFRSFRWTARIPRGRPFRVGPRVEPTLVVLGLVGLGATLAFPRVAYPLLWVQGVLLLEPLCRRLGRRSFLDVVARGERAPLVALCAGVLVCGFFWEMWNFGSFPKWVYHVPGVEFAYVFEMPLLGYLGYLPFALELVLLTELFLPAAADPLLDGLADQRSSPASSGSASAASRTGSAPVK